MLKYISAISLMGFSLCGSDVLPGDEGVPISMYERRQEAWDEHRVDDLAKDFQDDAEYFEIDGQSYRGKDEIKAHYQELLDTTFKGRKFKELVVRRKFISSDVAVVDTNWAAMTSNSKVANAGSSIVVLRKKDDKWKIAYLRHVPIVHPK